MSRMAKFFMIAFCPKCHRRIGQVMVGLNVCCRECMVWFIAEKEEKEVVINGLVKNNI